MSISVSNASNTVSVSGTDVFDAWTLQQKSIDVLSNCVVAVDDVCYRTIRECFDYLRYYPYFGVGVVLLVLYVILRHSMTTSKPPPTYCTMQAEIV
uniref:Uncharacterized protein n=1 Tax=viral metagenome TaxID=1070528 RepID=A0A6C0CSZ3_9ZZZZ